MQTHRFVHTALAAAMALGACSTIPENNARLDEARSDYRVAQSSPQVTAHAGTELKQANDALNKANDAWSKNEDVGRVDQLAYLAKQRIAIAQEAARLRAAEAATRDGGAERGEARLAARTSEADAANRNAEISQRQADAAQMHADASQRQSEESQRQAASQQQRALDAEMRSGQLEMQLEELAAKKTERGLVVTFGDLLFDSGMAEIKPGGMRDVQKLADVLKQYPERKVLIEGFTDSTGADSYNQDLSDRRADAVRASLRDMGIDDDRVTGRGYGKNFPVASNDTAANRQLNRRVEVVISDASGHIAPR